MMNGVLQIKCWDSIQAHKEKKIMHLQLVDCFFLNTDIDGVCHGVHMLGLTVLQLDPNSRAEDQARTESMLKVNITAHIQLMIVVGSSSCTCGRTA